MIDNEWEEPEDLEDAAERKRILIGEIEEIEAQLCQRKNRHPSFEEDHDGWQTYQEWRGNAVWARTSRLQGLRLVKKWISQHQDDHKENEPIAH